MSQHWLSVIIKGSGRAILTNTRELARGSLGGIHGTIIVFQVTGANKAFANFCQETLTIQGN
jgi:hypothetical protein